MDITNFMTWFINQAVNMFSWFFNILDSITFMGTSLLKVCITIMILVPLLSVVLTLSTGVSVIGSKSERIETKREIAQAKKERASRKNEH